MKRRFGRCSVCAQESAIRCGRCGARSCSVCSVVPPGSCAVCEAGAAPKVIRRPRAKPEPGLIARAPVALDDVDALDLLVGQMEIGGVADSTRRKYESASVRFARWAASMGASEFPSTPQTVCRYIAAELLAGRSSSSIGVHVAAIAWLHRQGHVQDPTRSPRVRAVLAEYRRRRGTASRDPRRALARAELGAMVRICGPGLLGLRDAALLTLGWSTGLRRRELVALDVEDLETVPPDLAVTVRRSKADQEGAGRVVGVPLSRDVEVCAVRRVRAWIDDAELGSGALFRRVDRWGRVGDRLDPRSVHRIVRTRACRAFLEDIGELGAHSLRAGLITGLRQAHVSLDDIARHVGHSSIRSTAGYVRVVDALDERNPLRRL